MSRCGHVSVRKGGRNRSINQVYVDNPPRPQSPLPTTRRRARAAAACRSGWARPSTGSRRRSSAMSSLCRRTGGQICRFKSTTGTKSVVDRRASMTTRLLALLPFVFAGDAAALRPAGGRAAARVGCGRDCGALGPLLPGRVGGRPRSLRHGGFHRRTIGCDGMTVLTVSSCWIRIYARHTHYARITRWILRHATTWASSSSSASTSRPESTLVSQIEPESEYLHS